MCKHLKAIDIVCKWMPWPSGGRWKPEIDWLGGVPELGWLQRKESTNSELPIFKLQVLQVGNDQSASCMAYQVKCASSTDIDIGMNSERRNMVVHIQAVICNFMHFVLICLPMAAICIPSEPTPITSPPRPQSIRLARKRTAGNNVAGTAVQGCSLILKLHVAGCSLVLLYILYLHTMFWKQKQLQHHTGCTRCLQITGGKCYVGPSFEPTATRSIWVCGWSLMSLCLCGISQVCSFQTPIRR